MQTVDFRHLPLCPGDRVLDLGCGEGRHVISAYVEADVQSIGVDLSLDDLRTTRDKYQDFAEPEVVATFDDFEVYSNSVADGEIFSRIFELTALY